MGLAKERLHRLSEKMGYNGIINDKVILRAQEIEAERMNKAKEAYREGRIPKQSRQPSNCDLPILKCKPLSGKGVKKK